MKNIHILPTDKPSRLISSGKEFTLLKNTTIDKRCKNIYITSDEEIKEGDWFLTPTNDLRCANIEWRITISQFIPKTDFKKIILTDNQDLIKDGIQAIDDEFLEWFVKNSSCEVVELANSLVRISSFDWRTNYKIIIPKEEIYFDFIGELDGLPNLLDVIKEKFSTKEEQCTCKEHDPYCCQIHGSCPTCVTKKEPKQETLEEAAERYNSQFINQEENKFSKEDFINGAKWQQERSYSEEEVIQFGKFLTEFNNLDNEIECAIKKLLEQFKNK